MTLRFRLITNWQSWTLTRALIITLEYPFSCWDRHGGESKRQNSKPESSCPGMLQTLTHQQPDLWLELAQASAPPSEYYTRMTGSSFPASPQVLSASCLQMRTHGSPCGQHPVCRIVLNSQSWPISLSLFHCLLISIQYRLTKIKYL